MTTNLVLDSRARAMLAEMGVRVWLPSDATPIVALPQAIQPALAEPIAIPVRREPPLRLPVLSTPPAVIGSAPVRYVMDNLPEGGDFEIILLGEPCTGDAEKLLASMMRLLGTKTFAAQMVSSQNEAESLADQLAKIPSKVIVALGPHAARALLDKTSGEMPFGKLRGTAHRVDGLGSRVVVTYHPLQLLRQPLVKAQAWIDLKLVMKVSLDEN